MRGIGEWERIIRQWPLLRARASETTKLAIFGASS
jgi:hypothetical protein